MILRYIKTYTSQFQGENFSKKNGCYDAVDII